MSSILKFITVIQKILIILCILCFIPTSVFVFVPKDHQFSQQQINTYKIAYAQVYTPFIVSFNQHNCTYRQAMFNNDQCFIRANPNTYAIMSKGSTVACTGANYEVEYIKFCSGIVNNDMNQIKNSFVNQTASGFVHSNTSFPIFSISLNQTIYYHYVPDSKANTCKTLASTLSQNIQLKYSIQYHKMHTYSSQLLWFSILPIVTILILMIIINEVTDKFNLRKYIVMACIAVNVGLMTIIIKGIIYFTDLQKFKNDIVQFSSCFVKDEGAVLNQMGYFDFGFGFGFVFSIGIVLLLIFLSMVGQLLAKLLEIKYYNSRDSPDSTGIQLSDLKTSLRSRIINKQSNSSSRNIKLKNLQ